ncbi:MAG: biotin--[acetyl-CoA-carboxylase] ligase [Lachnospiraceae bacterium]
MNTKTALLQLLEAHKETYLSGEAVAASLQISRNAVWKAMQELRKEGHVIEAVPRKGYRMSSASDVLTEEGIRFWLQEECQEVPLQVFESLPSTNTTAKEMAINGAAHGSVLLAKEQTQGRGRFNRNFCSPQGGLYMSLIVRPQQVHLENPTLLTLYAAVVVCEVIEELTGQAPEIKWVNDIFLNDKKICGILTEAAMDYESASVQWVVLGIGLNLYTEERQFPKALRDVAGSVCPGGSSGLTRNRFAAAIISHLLRGWERLASRDTLLKAYKARLSMLGRQVLVTQGIRQYTATALDLDADGHLLVETEEGERVYLSSGEVSVRRER